MGLLFIIGAALAAEPGDSGVRIAARATGESLSDPWISDVYRPSLFTGGLGMVIPIREEVQLEIEGSYVRMAGQERLESDGGESSVEETLELIPISALGAWRFPLGRGELFVGAGPALVSFKALHSPNEDNEDVSATVGAKLGLEMRVGMRLDTGMIRPPIAPVSGRPAQALEFEIYAGRRHQLHLSGEGYDLGAWRAAAGLALRF
jgi:hypothetical protein